MSDSTFTRAHRSCLLVVGHDLAAEQLAQVLRQPPRCVDDLFEAMGELTVAPARNPIAVALISDALLQPADGAAIEALRRIDPAVRLIRTCGAGVAPPEVDGFDAALTWPPRAEELAQVLGEELIDLVQAGDAALTGGARVDEAAPVEGAATFEEDEDPPFDEDLPAAKSREASAEEGEAGSLERTRPPTCDEDGAVEVRHSSWLRSESMRREAAPERGPELPPARRLTRQAPPEFGLTSVAFPPAPSPASAPPSPEQTPRSSDPRHRDDPSPPDADLSLAALTAQDGAEDEPCLRKPPPLLEDLGDIDLVQAVVLDPQGVRPTALALLRQQTEWKDVHFIDENGHVPDGATCVDVRRGDRTYGRLISSDVSASDLRPWGQWLSHWLMLDEAYRSYRLLTYRDELTGAWNRRYFHRFMKELITEARERRRQVSVMVFDIDEFKRFNDEFSHEAGDVILVETVALLNSVIRRGDRVCRIGGDEFAVVFADLAAPREAGSTHPASVELIARRFQEQICRMHFPKLGLEAPGNLSISAGLASFPWDGSEPAELLRLADQRALESKRKGKNFITFGPIAADHCD